MSTSTPETSDADDDSTDFQAIIQASTFETFVDNAATVADEARLHFDAGGVSLTVVDPANVAMVDQQLAAGAFEDYEGTGMVVGINLDRLADVVGMAEDGELLEIARDAESQMLRLQLSALEATIACIDQETIRAEPDLPDLKEDLTATATLQGSDLDRIGKATGLVGDRIIFGAHEDEATFYADGEGDTDQVRVEFDADDLQSLLLTDDARSVISLDYFDDVVTPIAASTDTTLQVGTEHPVVLKHSYADGAGQVTAMIAPRVEAE